MKAAICVGIAMCSLLPVTPVRGAADPCSVVTRDDAAAAVGMPISAVRIAPGAFGTTCSYDTGAAGHSLLLTVYRAESRREAAGAFERQIIRNEPLFVQPPLHLKGIGDDADAFGHVLWVRRADMVFVINVVDAGVRGATLPRAESLARKIVARIDRATGRKS